MATESANRASSDHKDEVEALRERLEAMQRRHASQTARANAAIAAAQDKSYWLDRWGVDLNALMRRRGASELRAGLRALRWVYRVAYDSRNAARGLVPRLRAGRDRLNEERAASESQSEDGDPGGAGSPDLLRSSPITDLLYGRLSKEDVAAVEGRLEPAEAALWNAAHDVDRRRLALALAAHYGVEPALERVGLSAAMPPPEVHSMARDAAAAGGSTYYADLVVDALGQTGLDPEAGQVALDFGCSSGRVVRVLSAALPEVSWHACDPLPDAIEWSRDHLPGISFLQSPLNPPLAYDEGAFDFVFAISIWSHFSEPAALEWLGEMRRIVRPGGRLLITTHGHQSIALSREAGLRPLEQLTEVDRALQQHGFWFAPEFGPEGDHGLVSPDWGTAFLSPGWLLARSTPEWRIALFAPGRVDSNQDLYVLERR